MKPSDVHIHAMPPLVGAFGHSECEHAAALLIRVSQVNGDKWDWLTPQQMGAAIKADLEAKTEPLETFARNPFFAPDYYKLVSEGFAHWKDGVAGSEISFTPLGLERLEKWSRA